MKQAYLCCAALVLALVCAEGQKARAAGLLPDSIAGLQQSMDEGSLTSEQLAAEALQAIDRHARLNAFISVDAPGAIEQARRKDRRRAAGQLDGPLHGIPIAIKDNIHVAGMPNTAGTPVLRAFVPAHDAPAVARLRSAGAIVLGKTNMHELAFGITSKNAAFGTVGNACNPDFIAGGSSGGTAVAIAAGMAVAGLGTDTGGSSRIPAALNGIVGFRPTLGRYPASGLTRISSTRDTVGSMARSVADVALLDAVMAGEAAGLEEIELDGLRLGVPRDHFFDGLEPLVASRVETLLTALRGAGVELVEENIRDIAVLNEAVSFPVVLYETGQLLPGYLAQYLPLQDFEALASSIASRDVRDIMAGIVNGGMPETAYRQAINHDRPRLRSAYAGYFREHRVAAILFPTTPLTARRIAETGETVELNGGQVPTFPTYIRNTDPGSNAGIPGLSLPLPAAPGEMPAGVGIDGPEGADRQLLAIGAAIETLIQEVGGYSACAEAGAR